MPFPITYFTDNIIFNRRGEAFAVYRLAGRAYHFLPAEQRSLAVRQFEEFLYGFSGEGAILLLAEELRPSERGYLASAGAKDEGSSPGRAKELATHARAVRTAFSFGARARRRYLVLRLSLGGGGDLSSFFQEFRESVLALFAGQEVWDAPSSARLREAKISEEQMHRRIRQICPDRGGWADLDFIIRRTAKRTGVLPPPLPSRDGGKITPGVLASFSEGGYIFERPSHLEVHGESGVHYQTFVTFPDLPLQVAETGSEWLASLDSWPFSVDAAVHFTVEKPHAALARVKSKYRFFKGQAEETLSGAGEIGEIEEDALARGRDLEAKIASGMPLVQLSVTLGLGAADLGELQGNAARIVEHYSASGFRAVRPLGEQSKCFYSFIPGAGRAAPWVPCDPGYLAAAAPFASAESGDGAGFLLGWSGASPVFWQPGRAARELNITGAVLATGSLGGGKSVFGKYLAYLTRLAGGLVFVLDPKDEYRALGQIFPETAVFDLSMRGGVSLNPFFLSPDAARARSIALDYLCLALNVKEENEARRVAVSQVVERVASLPPGQRHLGVCLEEFAGLAGASPHHQVRAEAGQCALLLESLRDSSLGRLVFGKGTGLELSPVTVLNLAELPLPKRDESGRVVLTESERQGLGLMYLAAAMARETAFRVSPGTVKAVIFDEAWMLLYVAEGARLLSEIVRMGRTYNLAPVLLTQNASDVADPGIRNNLGYVACFRAASAEEIKAGVGLLGADPEEAAKADGMMGAFPRLESGRCFFRDAEGRIALVHIDPRPSYLLDVFDTRPKKGGGGDAKAEESA